MATRSIHEILARRALDLFVGRRTELARLLASLDDSGALVTHVHGIAGIGKSALLNVYAVQAAAPTTVVVRLDARLFEPTAAGFLEELASTICVPPGELSLLAPRVVLIIDGYELLRVLDTWLRQDFVPSLQDNVHIVIASRQSPSIPWLIDSHWQGLFQTIHLEALPDSDALELLARRGFSEVEALALNRIAKGHPLALSLASRLLTDSTTNSQHQGAESILERLAQLYLSDTAAPDTRQALEASSILRRVTQPMLTALFPKADSARLWEDLSRHPFFEASREGLILHDAVRPALASSLRVRDPVRYLSYRRAAWRHLRAELAEGSPGQRGRVTFDLIFLLEHPGVREAFFPTHASQLSVEPATPSHRVDIFSIAHRYESPQAAQVLLWWWDRCPEAFRIVRDQAGVAGFYVCIEASRITAEFEIADAMVSGWAQHLRDQPLARGQKAILIRRWLSEQYGEAPCAVQAECWLDVKRTYLEMRASLRRCYIAVSDLTPFAPAAQFLGFTPIPSATAKFEGRPHHLAMLDFGPGSLDGWISGLLARELDSSAGELLDRDARQVCVDGERIDLTSLEFGVLSLLKQHEGKAISRDQLLAEVWGQSFDSGSNVVDVVISSLRRKLGSQGGLVTTVRGLGYRFDRPRIVAPQR